MLSEVLSESESTAAKRWFRFPTQVPTLTPTARRHAPGMEQKTTGSNVVTNPPVQPRSANAHPSTPQPEDDDLFCLFGCIASLIIALGIGIVGAVLMLERGNGLGAAILGFLVGFLGTLIGIAQAAGENTSNGDDETPRVVTQPMPLHAKIRAEREGVDPVTLVDQMTTTPAPNGRDARVHVVRMPDGGHAVVTSGPNGPQRTHAHPRRLSGKEKSRD